MKVVTFTPLRKVKRLDKIVVAAYGQWNRLLSSDHDKYILELHDVSSHLNQDDFVHNHKGELLFFYTHNPNETYVFNEWEQELWEGAFTDRKDFGIRWNGANPVNYNIRGADCYGTPCFSHYTMDYIGATFSDVTEFEPLTVGRVKVWLDCIISRLKNAEVRVK